ncbi:nucleic acid/nucleotide deaminase domain-containing protein [Streptomyces sp. NBRC 109706]|uniref:nucleic acid/nucleotide deaminase domain-containing protein n=1 Tax=Streptomyces sp. NBRC 109706 TaxID=1550035 RepID=UPI00099C0747|nr:nucleic acid/nucleotide deaminase domain-containing protein [Streptomyces sp. NBRC 109706]
MAGLGRRIAEPVRNILDDIARKVPQGMERAHRRISERVRTAADRFDESERRITDRVPTYQVDNDGNVRRLMPDGSTREVSASDNSGIRNLLGPDGRATPHRSGQNLLPGPRDRRNGVVNSERVAPGSTELSRATQRARLADENRGGDNYAAFRYQGDDGDFILVGSSVRRGNVHSEQAAGSPFLAARDRLTGDVTEVYTERDPCGIPNGGRNCATWLAHYFGGDLPVSGSFEYGDAASRARGNTAHSAYVDGLFADTAYQDSLFGRSGRR